MKLYMHRVTKSYYDYDGHLESCEGLAWSSSGKAQDAMGFEAIIAGSFQAKVADKRADFAAYAPSNWELLEGEPVIRRVNLNPHGLM